MQLRTHVSRWICILGFTVLISSARADVIGYTEFDKWEKAIGDFTTIDFTGWQASTIITNQYSHLGVTFADGNDWIWNAGEGTFVEDGSGLHGNWLDLHVNIDFDVPQMWFGIDHPGSASIELYSGDDLIDVFHHVDGGIGFFTGVVSDTPFDRVRLFRVTGSPVVIDDLHFGIPAPGAVVVLALAGVFGTGSRRRRG